MTKYEFKKLLSAGIFYHSHNVCWVRFCSFTFRTKDSFHRNASGPICYQLLECFSASSSGRFNCEAKWISDSICSPVVDSAFVSCAFVSAECSAISLLPFRLKCFVNSVKGVTCSLSICLDVLTCFFFIWRRKILVPPLTGLRSELVTSQTKNLLIDDHFSESQITLHQKDSCLF